VTSAASAPPPPFLRLRSRWIRALAPVLGADGAGLVAELHALGPRACVGLLALRVEELDAAIGPETTDAELRRHALAVIVVYLREPDGYLPSLGARFVDARYRTFCRIAARLRDERARAAPSPCGAGGAPTS
jgi:hypothetical protein